MTSDHLFRQWSGSNHIIRHRLNLWWWRSLRNHCVTWRQPIYESCWISIQSWLHINPAVLICTHGNARKMLQGSKKWGNQHNHNPLHLNSTHLWLGFGMYNIIRADSSFVPSQWEMVLHCNHVSHRLGTNLESAQIIENRQQDVWVEMLGRRFLPESFYSAGCHWKNIHVLGTKQQDMIQTAGQRV